MDENFNKKWKTEAKLIDNTGSRNVYRYRDYVLKEIVNKKKVQANNNDF